MVCAPAVIPPGRRPKFHPVLDLRYSRPQRPGIRLFLYDFGNFLVDLRPLGRYKDIRCRHGPRQWRRPHLNRNCGQIAGPWAYGGAPRAGCRGRAMDLLIAKAVQILLVSSPRSRHSDRSLRSNRLTTFSCLMSALCGRMQVSPLLISHRASCGLSHRTLGAARRHHWNLSFSPASWQSRGRSPNARHRIVRPAQGVLGLGSQFSP